MATKAKARRPSAGIDASRLPASVDGLLTMADVCAAIKIGLRTLKTQRAAGAFPPADAHVGEGSKRSPRWRVSTINAHIDGLCEGGG